MVNVFHMEAIKTPIILLLCIFGSIKFYIVNHKIILSFTKQNQNPINILKRMAKVIRSFDKLNTLTEKELITKNEKDMNRKIIISTI